jgi:hypothetical protein
MGRGLVEGRRVTLTVTLDARDNETLEVAAGVLSMTPDELLGELLSGVSDHLKVALADFAREAKQLDPTARVALRGRALAREVMRRAGIK